MSKQCTSCKQDKPTTSEYWYPKKKGTTNWQSRCKACQLALAKTRNASNPNYNRRKIREWEERQKAKDPNWRLRKLLRQSYGISLEDYQAILERQHYCCAACGLPDGENGHLGRLFVDHCHETGKVRGLLCNSCNTALGLLREDPAIINGLLDYAIDIKKKDVA